MVRKADKYVVDGTNPKLVGFTYTIDATATLVLEFDEPMLKSSLVVKEITLQDAKIATVSHKLSVKSTCLSKDGEEFSIVLDITDSDAIKIAKFCTTDKPNNCFISFTDALLTDMAKNKVVALVNKVSSVQATSVGADKVDVELKNDGFTLLDLNAHTLTLSFSEPVDPLSINYQDLSLQEIADDDKAFQTLKLTKGTTKSNVGNVIVIDLDIGDVNALKLLDSASTNGALCTNAKGNNCILRLQTTFIKDVSGNGLKALVKTDFIAPQKLVLDSTAPVVKTVSLNVNTGSISLTFDEPVQSDGLAPSAITLQNNPAKGSASETLTLSETVVSGSDSTIVTFTIHAADNTKLKALGDLCTKASNAFLSAVAGMVEDKRNNKNKDITTGIQIAPLVGDTTPPTLLAFAAANPNTGALTLSFNEPVDIATLVYTSIVVQNNNAGNGLTYTLQDVWQGCVREYCAKTEVVITMADSDLQALQRLGNTIFTTKDNTFITVKANAIADMSAQKFAAGTTKQLVAMGNRVKVTLVSYSLDMSKGELGLLFDGSVKKSSFKPDKLTLSSAKSGTGIESFEFTKDTTCSSQDGFAMTLNIGSKDLNNIKKLRNLATSDTSTFLYFTADVFDDLFD